MKSACFLLICVLLSLLHSSQGWWDTGHMLVSQIGYNYLSQNESSETRDALQNAFDALQTYYADSATFVTSACWMDDLKKRNVTQFDNWHFINIPLCDDGINAPCDNMTVRGLVNERDNIVWAINDAISVIRSTAAGGFERGFAMRNLIHLVGDIHQPLHSVTRYSANTPNGDQGGNLFHIPRWGPNGVTNLHSLWDSGAGLFVGLIRPLDPTNQSYIDTWAEKIMSQVNISAIGDQNNITAWAVEGVALASQYAYNLTYGDSPSDEYIAEAQAVIEQQIGIAGYRLAQVLKQIVLCNSNTYNCPVINNVKPCPGGQPKTHPVGYTVASTILAVALLASMIANVVFIYRSRRQGPYLPLKQ